MILIAAGGNLPYRGAPPERTIAAAFDALEEAGDIRVVARSRLYSSPAWPDPSAPPYVNAAARLETALTPEALLERLHAIEARFGRERNADDRWASRTLDLDLIDHDGAVRTPKEAGGLSLPHPRAAARAFVLLPLADVAPDWRTPDGSNMGGRGLMELIAALPERDRAATILLHPHTMP